MQSFRFSREQTQLFSDFQLNLVQHQEYYLNFIQRSFSLKGFEHQIKDKQRQFSASNRTLLFDQLQEQYQSVSIHPLVREHMESLLDANTFTVTTGHQLSLFSGPLFLIYKIVEVINMAKQLKEEYPEYNFVPVFWMASEDHDFEEVNQVQLFQKELNWETDQKGAVGRFHLEGFDEIKQKVLAFFEGKKEMEAWISSFDGQTYGQAFFHFIHHLFQEYGLICLDGDRKAFKKAFLPLLEKEISSEFSFQAVQKTNDLLEKEGIKLQVHAREVNLFYLDDQLRSRIIRRDDGFYIEGLGLYSQAALLDLMNEHPEQISPNVILRPLYQEFLLPNLCYVGGLGEINYWLQLKGVFDEAGVLFPMIKPRTSLLYIDEITSKKIEGLELPLEDLFLDKHQLIKKHIQQKESEAIDFTAMNEVKSKLGDQIKKEIEHFAPSLAAFGASEWVKIEKSIENIQGKIFKTQKVKHENDVMSIEQMKDRLFPDGGFQERKMSFLSMCGKGDLHVKLNQLMNAIDPFSSDFILLKETPSVK